MGFVLYRRQQSNVASVVDDSQYWWYSQTAFIVKWSLFGAFILFFLLWFIGGYLHAQRRINKGLPPLGYHRFLVPYSQRAQFEPSLQNQFSFYQAQAHGYDLESMPPPVYDPNHAPPPSYQPPNGATKASPNQNYEMPPPGSPGH